jgi:copper homeostasis protein
MERANYSISRPQGLTLEICIDSVESAIAAEQGGAQRVELCDYLNGGGTTPSAGMIEVVRKKINIGLHVLIRPRRGDFLYSDPELEVMKRDIKTCKELGANGVVLGVLTRKGTIDTARMQELIDHCGTLSITFHRAFDMTPDPIKALDDLLELKVHRLLTSGQQQFALQGVELIRELNERAAGKLIIMPGSGVNEENVSEIIARTGVNEVHASARKEVNSEMVFRKDYPPMSGNKNISEYEQLVADKLKIQKMRESLSQMQDL